jgi:hypothetical protein
MSTNKTPAVGCGIVIVLVTGWLILYAKKKCPTVSCKVAANNCSSNNILAANNCSSKNILCPDAKLENGVFKFGQITIYLCDPFEKAKHYGIFINGEEALKVNWKNESDQLTLWVSTCVETNSICCIYGGKPSAEICFIDNGNLTLKTDRNLYSVNHQEGKFLLHFLTNPIS